MNKTPVAEIAAPAVAMAGSMWGIISDELLLYTVLPSFLGALLSTYQRWRSGKSKGHDLVAAAISAVFFGCMIGPYVALSMPNSEAAVGPACFLFAQLGARLGEKLPEYDFDIGELLTSIVRAILPKKDGR